MSDQLNEKALAYHCMYGKPGKLEVVPTKPCSTAQDLSLAYTPGVAAPVLAIADDPEAAWEYTSRGNLVAVVSNGSAILGLGNRGALAGKPVMEGKAVLFKRFADVDVFDLELDTADPELIIQTMKILEPTFGGINLEDIKAPECFEIEQRLIDELSIPVFHDDQHGTAIISTAGLLNVMEISGKKIDEVRIVVNGAGAAGISCSRMFIAAGVNPENMILCDSRGVINQRRTDLTSQKKEFINRTDCETLEDAVKGADVFVGLSVPDCLTPAMLKTMNSNPAVFAMANPNPEIRYDLAKETRSDLIMATGRSDFPNQINNVLGFPYIFRGALDVRATKITEGMKMAAALALAALAHQPVPDMVARAYGGQQFSFGPEYIVPKPFDPRVIEWEAVAVARAACEEGVARKPVSDWNQYKAGLNQRMAGFWAQK